MFEEMINVKPGIAHYSIAESGGGRGVAICMDEAVMEESERSGRGTDVYGWGPGQ